MYIHFVSFEIAFDSVHRDSLLVIMKNSEMLKKLIKMVKPMYDVIYGNEIAFPFPVMIGVIIVPL